MQIDELHRRRSLEEFSQETWKNFKNSSLQFYFFSLHIRSSTNLRSRWWLRLEWIAASNEQTNIASDVAGKWKRC